MLTIRGYFSLAATLEGFHHWVQCCNAQSAADSTTFSDSLLMTASSPPPPVGATQRRGAAACQPRTSSQSRKGVELIGYPGDSPLISLPRGAAFTVSPAKNPPPTERFCLVIRLKMVPMFSWKTADFSPLFAALWWHWSPSWTFSSVGFVRHCHQPGKRLFCAFCDIT